MATKEDWLFRAEHMRLTAKFLEKRADVLREEAKDFLVQAARAQMMADKIEVDPNIEANANLVLWCVHVIGSDDVYAAESHVSAISRADELNRSIWSRPRPEGSEDICCFAYADVWPWTPEGHAKSLDKYQQEIASKKDR